MARREPVRARVKIPGMGHIEFNPMGPRVRIGRRVFPSDIFVNFPSDSASPSLWMHLGFNDGVPSCRELTVKAKGGERGVSGSDLRHVRLEEWLEDLFALVAEEVVEESPDGHVTATVVRVPTDSSIREGAKAIQAARRSARRKITNSLLHEVADVYREQLDEAPTQAVQRHFAVSYRTAGDYIRRAREAGLLAATTRGRRNA